MNNENFVSGDMTGSNPVLIAKFSDENGINTSGGLGHELLAVLDGVTKNPFVLNNFYRTNLGDFQSGSLKYLFNNLTPGSHELSVTAWDTYNNPLSPNRHGRLLQVRKESSSASTRAEVSKSCMLHDFDAVVKKKMWWTVIVQKPET